MRLEKTISFVSYRYLILDIFSRKIVGWEVHEEERAELATGVIQSAVWTGACIARPSVLQADNGAPMPSTSPALDILKRAHGP